MAEKTHPTQVVSLPDSGHAPLDRRVNLAELMQEWMEWCQETTTIQTFWSWKDDNDEWTEQGDEWNNDALIFFDWFGRSDMSPSIFPSISEEETNRGCKVAITPIQLSFRAGVAHLEVGCLDGSCCLTRADRLTLWPRKTKSRNYVGPRLGAWWKEVIQVP